MSYNSSLAECCNNFDGRPLCCCEFLQKNGYIHDFGDLEFPLCEQAAGPGYVYHVGLSFGDWRNQPLLRDGCLLTLPLVCNLFLPV